MSHRLSIPSQEGKIRPFLADSQPAPGVLTSKQTVNLVALALWASLVGYAVSVMETNIEDIVPWLPDDTTDLAEYGWFVDRFGSDDLLMVSWEECRLGDPRVGKLATHLEGINSPLISQVVSPQETLDRLTGRGSGLSRSEAIERLKGFQVGPDGQATCLLVYLSPEGMSDRRRSVLLVIQSAEEVIGLKRDALRLGGHPYLGFYSSQVTLDAMVGLSIPVAALSTLFAFLAFRSIPLLLVTLCSSGAAALTALATVPLTGEHVNGLLTALPSLVYIVTTSGAVHLVNYSQELLGRDDPNVPDSADAFRRRLREKAIRPCLLSAASTGLGTLSLTWSAFPAIRDFGLYATAGIAIAFVVQIVLIPDLLSLNWVRRSTKERQARPNDPLIGVLHFVVSHRTTVAVVTLLLTAVLAAPLARLKGQFSISQLFADDSEFSRNVHWLEQHLGPIDTTEVVVGFQETTPAGFFVRMERVARLEAKLAKIDQVGASFSSGKVLPAITGTRPFLGRIFARTVLERRRESILGGPYVVEYEGREYWRITLRSSMFLESERDNLRREIRRTVTEEIEDWPDEPSQLVTGASQLFLATKDDVLADFVESLLLAYGLITVMMMLALRSLIGGLLAMLPNAIPCLTVFGLLGWLDGAIDIGMTVAACIALGIAVDDTSHLVMSFRRARTRTRTRLRALEIAARQCSRAMCQTSLICGLSMAPYLFGQLIYLNRFGLLLPTLMAAALIGDLLLLPALIAGESGRFFERNIPTNGKDAS